MRDEDRESTKIVQRPPGLALPSIPLPNATPAPLPPLPTQSPAPLPSIPSPNAPAALPPLPTKAGAPPPSKPPTHAAPPPAPLPPLPTPEPAARAPDVPFEAMPPPAAPTEAAPQVGRAPPPPTQHKLSPEAELLRRAEEEIARIRAQAKRSLEEETGQPAPDLMEDVELQTETVEALAPALPNISERVSTKEAALSLVDVAKSYFKGNLEVRVLDGMDLEVPSGSFEALMGPSGSGKSTLLHLIAGLDRPTAGSIRVAGADLGSMSEEQLSHWRARTIGFIFQHYNLLPVLTAAQNVELPLLLRKDISKKDRQDRVRIALRVVGLEDRLHYYPKELSGGQEQRVAIARAIVTDPKILICDEPTGDLDRGSADAILELLMKLNRDFEKTIFMVTHDPEAAGRATLRRTLSKGRLL